MILDSHARPIMPEMGPVSFAPPAEDAPRDTDPTPVAPPDPAAPKMLTSEQLGPTIRAMDEFTQARKTGADPVPALRRALGEFAKVAGHSVVEGSDFEFVRDGSTLAIKDTSPAGEMFLNEWSQMIAGLDEQAQAMKAARTDQVVAALMATVERLQRQVDNLAIDVRNLQKKIRS